MTNQTENENEVVNQTPKKPDSLKTWLVVATLVMGLNLVITCFNSKIALDTNDRGFKMHKSIETLLWRTKRILWPKTRSKKQKTVKRKSRKLTGHIIINPDNTFKMKIWDRK